ncbi:fibrobacter succinogenes major paralogous domain-containing protein [Fibrobacter sp. UWB7]|uniref:fibrobacter succinogenes major paralogous domain-containing protein n=1 Tax=Fibrobacter sp. UWB7 TaxID=1896206 RepID=UPI000924669B|nr:fibrobacter succinogenes major paralogous domain-containing protein [Fibrobacter sp. UWB7]SHM88984.1 major paralogous domain-containing protein [Fibrobacter sp. UWB7]
MKKGLFKIAAVALFLIACTESNVAGGSSGDAGVYAVKDLDVAGVTQKGPFVSGSAVTVHGIDCKTLKISDEYFEGEVKSDKGDFIVEGVSLKSTCAVFEVTGKYRSEISGKETDGELTLRALTDLENHEKVNVNILTNLEYERVVYLVTQKGKSFAEAKKQAEKEVLAAFDIIGSFEAFETLNIFESGDGNAALLAVSVMMQGGADVGALVKRMDKFDDSFAEAGVWSDSSTKTAITEWVSAAAADGQLDSIRKNVEGWGIAAEVPAFEKYVEKFGNDSSIAAQNTMTDPRDGKTYRTVKIGDQVWMAENLNYETEKSYCYNDSTEYCAMYGRFYEWNAAMRACPEGWHLPLLEEFKTLVDALGDSAMAGSKLKSTSGWLNDLNGTDDYGFTVLPIGGKSASGKYINKEWLADFWSSTESAVEFAYVMHLGAYFNTAPLDMDEGKYNAFSVRCLQGENDSLRSYILVEDSAVAACKTESTDDCEYGKLTDERNGQEYKTVKIGKQVWMAENLNYETDESYCYNDSAEYCTKYGRLYTWSAALNACPTGWHLPSQNEGMTLYYSVGGRDTAAKMLKSVNGWNDDGTGTDSFGFSALPVGDRDEFNDYENEGRFAGFWTSTEVNERYAAHIHLFYMDDDAALSTTFNKRYAYAVRCVKD